MRKVAQALAEIQKNGHSERRLTLGFLGAWPSGLTAKPRPEKSKKEDVTQLSMFDKNGE